MLVVLEGADGVGKTTLAQILSNVLNAEVIHATRETPNDWKFFSGILDDAKTRNIIMDRAFWGQFVYQTPDERHLSYEQLDSLETRLQNEGGKLIYVCAPEDVIKARLDARSEIPSLPVETMLMHFGRMAYLAKCPVIKYDTYTGKVDFINVRDSV